MHIVLTLFQEPDNLYERKIFLPNDPCVHHETSRLSTSCNLYGDPHLKTFNDTFSTCKIKGTWPMLVNKHLAIQVISEEVRPNYVATAITKVRLDFEQINIILTPFQFYGSI